MASYTPTIGLEIHAELKTETKMFCNSKNDPDETQPNVNVCPICMGHPGTLPTINKEAVRHVLKVGVALGGTLADFTEFDRKNYFYPDIPKGYQISQYKYPLVTGGSLNNIAITRIHLEEDTALNKHEGDHSLVDFNRAGIPLMELVTEPVIHSGEDAVAFAKELQLLLRYLGVAEANMEKGELRIEANVSVSKTDEFGTKTEVKNLNSFRSVGRAIQYEIERQISVLEGGGTVVQETRGWNEDTGETFSQREKESSHDYRYFPEPDLPKLKLSEIPEFSEAVLKEALPELPWQKREQYKAVTRKEKFEINGQTIELFVTRQKFGFFFDDVVKMLGHGALMELAANYIGNDLVPLVGGIDADIPVQPAHFAKLMQMIGDDKISTPAAKEILKEMVRSDQNPEKIAEEKNLLQKSDEGELQKIVEQVIAENTKVVEEYKSGKETALQFLVGQGMRLSKGAANPQIFTELLKKSIKN